MPRIYVSHSRDFDYKKELYGLLKNSHLDIEFIFPHENSDEPFNTRELLEKKEYDFVMAEVSKPATGQGIELGWASMLNIPIVCIYKKDSKISGSLKVITQDFVEYENSDDLINKLTVFFKQNYA